MKKLKINLFIFFAISAFWCEGNAIGYGQANIFMTTTLVPYSRQLSLSKRGKNKGKYFAIISYWWYDWINQWDWFILKDEYNKYAMCSKTKMVLHRVIMGIFKKDSGEIDHIDHDGLNNNESNLRICNHAENMRNQKRTSNKYRGVYSFTNKKGYSYYTSAITINRKRKHIGTFPYTEEGAAAAAKSYDKINKELHGEFAILNFNNQ